jgi:hypothetical protein
MVSFHGMVVFVHKKNYAIADGGGVWDGRL